MTFLVTLIALLIERFFDCSHLRNWQWYDLYQHTIIKRFEKQSSWVLLVITIIPLLLVVGIIQFALRGVLYGFLSLIFEVVLVLYCIGPQNLWADTYACINTFEQDNAENAKQKFAILFGVKSRKVSHERLIDKIFLASNNRVFAIIFWFVLLGPVGAILYRGISLLTAQTPYQHVHAEYTPASMIALKLLDWLPVRLFTFLFALGGHFTQVLSLWRKDVLTSYQQNDAILTECGFAALGRDELDNGKKDSTPEKDALSLLDRVFIIGLVIVAIFTLVF